MRLSQGDLRAIGNALKSHKPPGSIVIRHRFNDEYLIIVGFKVYRVFESEGQLKVVDEDGFSAPKKILNIVMENANGQPV